MRRQAADLGIPLDVCAAIVDRICALGRENDIYFSWRPHLPDADDDFPLDLAIRCGASHLVTYNLRHLAPATQFGIRVVTPREFLRTMGEETA
jgi:predicted nucleic acid-binding protein